MKMPRKEGWTSRSLIHLQLQLRILPRQHIRLLPRVQVRLQRLPKQWRRPKRQKWLFSTWWLENKKKVQETIFSCAFERNYQICNSEKKILICKSVLDFLLLEFKYAFFGHFFPIQLPPWKWDKAWNNFVFDPYLLCLVYLVWRWKCTTTQWSSRSSLDFGVESP